MLIRRLLAAMVVVAVGAIAPASPAAAAPQDLLLRQGGTPPQGVVEPQAPPQFAHRGGTGSGKLALRPKTAGQTPAQPPGAQPFGEGGGYGCDTVIDWDFSSVGEDDYLEQTVDVLYYGDVMCNFYLYSIEGIAGVWDRSEDFNGESFDGDVLDVGNYVYTEWDYKAYSVGGFGVRARQYNGARRVEPGVEWYLEAPEGFIWDACNPLPGLRYLICDGLGTSYLHVLIGAFGQSTGLARACRDQNAAVDAEQARVVRLFGAAPASTQIIRQIPAIKQMVVTFKKDLCALTSSGSATSFAAQRGLDLWEMAVAQAKNNAAAGDDRPLYWARLVMTRAISQWRPTFAADRNALQAALDKASRGMTSHSFSAGGKKVFISGFDPFGLDGSVLRGNPSGAAVLKLDGTAIDGAQVQSVIFPVRFAEFNEGLVEQVFGPHLAPGGQQADLITTVSQGDARFDLEFYNGRRRATTFADNRNVSGGGSEANPIVPPGMPAGEEFVQTTLPVDSMQVGSPHSVAIHTVVVERISPSSANSTRGDGPTLGSMAVEGGGGSYLSNEIAYRVTRLRDQLGVAVAAGHVHTPVLNPPGSVPDDGFNNARQAIVAQYCTILRAAIAAPTTPPVQVTADRSTYRVGETPVYSVIGAPNALVKWTGVKDGVITPEEVDKSYGHTTDGSRRWTGSYHQWQPGQAGQWVKWVRVGGRLAKVQMTVQNAPAQPRRVAGDFDGDRRTDFGLWRPGDATWYVHTGEGGSWGQVPFGLAGDLPVEGDFDGDLRTDRAVLRPADHTWHLLQSRDGYTATAFGQAGDVPVAGDYDGNGRTEIAVWRPSDGTWYIQPANAPFYGITFGMAGDDPVPGDYDGDGITDVAVYRPGSGLWIIRRSSDGQVVYTNWGLASDRPVSADYDGDGHDDIAVYRPGDGTWYIQLSSGGQRIESWGLGTDIATPGDFDRDGRADLAVFRPSEGIWYLRLSQGGMQYFHFGQSGDRPIPGVNATY